VGCLPYLIVTSLTTCSATGGKDVELHGLGQGCFTKHADSTCIGSPTIAHFFPTASYSIAAVSDFGYVMNMAEVYTWQSLTNVSHAF
jgi:hypothetical protein